MRAFSAVVILVFVRALAACDVGHGSECEDARQEVVRHIGDLCMDTGTAYPRSAFCTDCVAHQYHATTGAALCECRPLTFDAEFCTYAIGPESKARVRGAIDWANQQCDHFSLPEGDGGTVDAAVAEDSAEPDAWE
jgi:hypothetical protein